MTGKTIGILIGFIFLCGLAAAPPSKPPIYALHICFVDDKCWPDIKFYDSKAACEDHAATFTKKSPRVVISCSTTIIRKAHPDDDGKEG